MTKNKRPPAAALPLLAVLVAQSAASISSAQAIDQPVDQPIEERARIEEVVVTAPKRERRALQPAVEFDAAQIEERAPVIIRRLEEAYPDAHVALVFSNPLECLIATILSAQCTDEKVNEVTAPLFPKYRTAADYLSVPEDELKADIRPIGFFNQKAASIRAACERIVTAYGGEVPGTMEDLITLRGVARKTANIVLGNSFGIVEGIAVDTHVRRLREKLNGEGERIQTVRGVGYRYDVGERNEGA